MAVNVVVDSVAVSMKLNNGTDASGKIRTVSANIGSLTTGSGYTDEKAMNIVNLMKPCLAKTVYSTQKTTKSTLTSE